MVKEEALNILLTHINYNTTCLQLELSLQLACEYCRKEADLLSHKRKKRSTSRRLLLTTNKCQQPWDEKWAHLSAALYRKHNLVWQYLNLEVDRTIQYVSLWKSKRQQLTETEKRSDQPEELPTPPENVIVCSSNLFLII